jgi:CRISPR-associated protein Cst2
MGKKHFIQGFLLLDVDVAALNNAGKNSSSNFENAVGTKKIIKDRKSYVYVSGQAFRYWWRESLQKNFNWNMSPITRDKKIAYTEANPIKYPDDDIFGYMRALKEDGKNVTVTRISPLKNSALISSIPTTVAENWSSMARQEGDSVPYSKEEYSTIFKGMFSIDVEQVGTFSSYNKTGFQNLSDTLKNYALNNGAVEIDDMFLKNINNEPYKLVRLEKDVRKKRIIETLCALKYLNGGAMQTTNMADVTPKFVILCTTTSGNHPFSHIVGQDNGGYFDFKIDALEEVISEFEDKIDGNIFIGVRKGFLEKFDKDFENSLKKHQKIIVQPINKAIELFSETIEKYL